ncbi:MAG: hypothetical protein JWN12_602 [Candidatus Saccharibacteria bacterium]|nr:hypothetical protein [Candidatus Saccharibacteria bacterium]
MEGSIMASKEVSQLANQLWGLVVTEGVLAILAGIALLFWPSASAVLLVSLFGLFVLIWGIVGSVRSLISVGRTRGWWVHLVISVLLVALGVYLLRHVDVSLAAFILLIGFTFIVHGLFDVLTGLFGRESEIGDNKVLLVVLGLFGLAAGIITLVQPVASGLAFIWVAGVYALVYGVFTLAFAIKSQPE